MAFDTQTRLTGQKFAAFVARCPDFPDHSKVAGKEQNSRSAVEPRAVRLQQRNRPYQSMANATPIALQHDIVVPKSMSRRTRGVSLPVEAGETGGVTPDGNGRTLCEPNAAVTEPGWSGQSNTQPN